MKSGQNGVPLWNALEEATRKVRNLQLPYGGATVLSRLAGHDAPPRCRFSSRTEIVHIPHNRGDHYFTYWRQFSSELAVGRDF